MSRRQRVGRTSTTAGSVRIRGRPVEVFEPGIEHELWTTLPFVEDALKRERGGLRGVTKLLGLYRGIHVPERDGRDVKIGCRWPRCAQHKRAIMKEMYK